MSGTLRIDRVVTSGVFELDGGSWEVDNNVWLVGDDDEVVIVDAAHESQPITAAVGSRHVTAIVCTHGHNDHVTHAPQLAAALDAPLLLHPGDQPLWDLTQPITPDRFPRPVPFGQVPPRHTGLRLVASRTFEPTGTGAGNLTLFGP